MKGGVVGRQVARWGERDDESMIGFPHHSPGVHILGLWARHA